MNLVDALVKFRYYTRSKSQGNWTDAHAMAYLISAHARAHLEEIRLDKSRFLESYTITGTGAERYVFPTNMVYPLNLKDSNGNKYEPISYDDIDDYLCYVYYIFNTQIGIKTAPATGVELTLTYYKQPTVWSLSASPAGDSNLTSAAQEWAVLEAVCTAFTDRGDINLGEMRAVQAQYLRDMSASRRAEPTVHSFVKKISTGNYTSRIRRLLW